MEAVSLVARLEVRAGGPRNGLASGCRLILCSLSKCSTIISRAGGFGTARSFFAGDLKKHLRSAGCLKSRKRDTAPAAQPGEEGATLLGSDKDSGPSGHETGGKRPRRPRALPGADSVQRDDALRRAVETLSAEICWFLATDADGRAAAASATDQTDPSSRRPRS